MKITELKVRLWDDHRLRALVTVVFDDSFAVRNIKVIEGRDGRYLVAMPSRRLADGRYVDLAHPINAEFRAYVEDKVLGSFREELYLYEKDPDAYVRLRPAGRRDDLDNNNDEERGWVPRQ